MQKRYTYCCVFGGEEGDEWQIIDMGTKGYANLGSDRVVWKLPWKEEHEGTSEPPLELRTEYERLLRESGWTPELQEEPFNIVEMIADREGCAYDQPCTYGYRVETHAVYCHNRAWLYAPSKCRRHSGNSVWGDDPWPHEKCPGYRANP